MKRRWVLIALALAGAVVHAQAQAQAQATRAPKMGALGVFSVLGDSVQAAWSEEAPRDTRVERTSRESLEFKGIGFDAIALRTAFDTLQRLQPGTRVLMFKSPAPMTPAEQRALAEGAVRAELPAWMVKTLEANQLTHLLLVTRHRGSIDASTGDGNTIGRGSVEGIGFYMDTLYTLQNKTTGAVSTGLLAPFTHIRLTLMDAVSGDIVSSYDIKESFAFASTQTQAQADPWSFMPAEEKVRTLRRMVEDGMARGVAQVLARR
jgi:hypothetical protein